MLRITHRNLGADAHIVLSSLQRAVDAGADYEARVLLADKLWKQKLSTKERKAAFKAVRETLATMCVGSVRCAYCEDSLADEIEHIRPKSLFPNATFAWDNHCFACGPCNGPKNNRYGTINAGVLVEFVRGRNDPIIAPPAYQSALIDPRSEDPTDFLELDLGGQLANGQTLHGTFEFLPREDITIDQKLRAEFTIDVLDLNREVIRASRANAFNGFRARLTEYAIAVEQSANKTSLDALQKDLLRTPHLTVFYEMRRQRDFLPNIKALFERAPDALTWPVVV